MSANDSIYRPLVIDSPSYPLIRGKNIIEIPITVPDISGLKIEQGEGLTTALRFIGNNQNTSFHVNKIELIEIVDEDTKLTQAQYISCCDKLKELM